jgi:hypothetical protein
MKDQRPEGPESRLVIDVLILMYKVRKLLQVVTIEHVS